MNLCLRTKYTRVNLLSSLFRYSTIAPEVIEQNEQVLLDDTDDTRAREAEIARRRNVSRLSFAHYNLMNDRRPYEEPKCVAHLTVKYNRKVYGKYGSSSGVNPSICWPTQNEILQRQEYEAVAYPFTIKEMIESVTAKRREEKVRIDQREAELAAKFAKLALWKKELKNKTAKKMEEAAAAKAKKERLVEEVRRHFGFKLDPRDERFQEMLAKREKEQKKLERQAKKDAKEQAMIAKLQTDTKIIDVK